MIKQIATGVLVIAFVLTGSLTLRAQSPAKAGGYKEVSNTADDVIEAANFAIEEQSKKNSDQDLKLLTIERAEKQIVAGLNYKLCLSIENDDESQEVKVVVFKSLKKELKLTSWEQENCSGNEQNAKFISIKSNKDFFADLTPAAAKKQIATRSQQVISALKSKNMAALAKLVHPTKGVGFSLYGNIDAQNDLVFKPNQLKSLMTSKKKYGWGAEDGTGDQVKLTFPNFYKRFVYDKDFAAAPKVSYNEKLASGNTVYNGNEVYPNSIFVEYYFPGTDRNNFMDWKALYLTFEKHNNQWFLVNISHNQWTT